MVIADQTSRHSVMANLALRICRKKTDRYSAGQMGDDERVTRADTSILADFWVHDPFILANESDRTYYLYTSAKDAPVVTVYRSADLRNWVGPTTVFTIPDGSWANPAESPWAPEVHEFEGRFYLFTTLHDSTHALPAASDGTSQLSARHRDGQVYAPVARGTVIAVASSPLGPFELLDLEGPVAPREFMTLDGTLYVDESGEPWMVYAHEWVQLLDGTIEAIRLDAGTSPVGRKPHPSVPRIGGDVPSRTHAERAVTGAVRHGRSPAASAGGRRTADALGDLPTRRSCGGVRRDDGDLARRFDRGTVGAARCARGRKCRSRDAVHHVRRSAHARAPSRYGDSARSRCSCSRWSSTSRPGSEWSPIVRTSTRDERVKSTR